MAIRTEPALCTKTPVVGFKTPRTERVTATVLMLMDVVMFLVTVLRVERENRYRYEIFEISLLMEQVKVIRVITTFDA